MRAKFSDHVEKIVWWLRMYFHKLRSTYLKHLIPGNPGWPSLPVLPGSPRSPGSPAGPGCPWSPLSPRSPCKKVSVNKIHFHVFWKGPILSIITHAMEEIIESINVWKLYTRPNCTKLFRLPARVPLFLIFLGFRVLRPDLWARVVPAPCHPQPVPQGDLEDPSIPLDQDVQEVLQVIALSNLKIMQSQIFQMRTYKKNHLVNRLTLGRL